MDDLKAFTFDTGSHKTREEGMCLMESVAYLAGEKHTDRPKCADRTITSVAIFLNDSGRFDDRQAALADLPWRIVGTYNPEFDSAREVMYADFMEAAQARLNKECPFTDKTNPCQSLHVLHWSLDVGERGGQVNIWGFQWKHYSQMVLELLDKMIKLTEIQEVVPAREMEGASV